MKRLQIQKQTPIKVLTKRNWQNMVNVDPIRLLLVEDDPNDVELIQLALQRYNFVNQLDVVTDGEQALNYLYGRGGEPPNRPLLNAAKSSSTAGIASLAYVSGCDFALDAAHHPISPGSL